MTRTAIVGARVVDGDHLSEPTTVVVDGGVLLAETSPDGADVVDGAGATLLPGFIDSRAHPRRRDQLESAARAGITTIVDLGSPDPSTLAALRSAEGVPAIVSAGHVASGPGSMFIEDIGMPASTSPRTPRWPVGSVPPPAS